MTYFQLIHLTKLLDSLTHNLQFKGTVRLKIKLLSSFTVNLMLLQTRMTFILAGNTKDNVGLDVSD